MYFMQLTLLYDKDKVFVKLYKETENIEEICFDENNQLNLALTTEFSYEKRMLLKRKLE